MKVYIVHMWDSSEDTWDQKVFLNKEKAEEYESLVEDSYDSAYVEECETSDEGEFEEGLYITLFSGGRIPLEAQEIKKYSRYVVWDKKRKLHNWEIRKDEDNSIFFKVEFVVFENEHSDVLGKKYSNAFKDVINQMTDLKPFEEWTDKELRNWFEAQIIELLD